MSFIISTWTVLCIDQMLLPIPKGIRWFLLLNSPSLVRKRSGLNSLGLAHSVSSLWICHRLVTIMAPLGIRYLMNKNKIETVKVKDAVDYICKPFLFILIFLHHVHNYSDKGTARAIREQWSASVNTGTNRIWSNWLIHLSERSHAAFISHWVVNIWWNAMLNVSHFIPSQYVKLWHCPRGITQLWNVICQCSNMAYMMWSCFSFRTILYLKS